MPSIDAGDIIGIDQAIHENEDVHEAWENAHPEIHGVETHTDTDVTGAQLEQLTDGSNSDDLHYHDNWVINQGAGFNTPE